MRAVIVVVALLGAARAQALADDAKPLVGVRVRGDSKTTNETAMRLARVSLGDPISVDMLPELQAALLSSELFKSVTVWLEEAPGGVIIVATLEDKWSWVAAPTLYLLPDNWSVGVGYAENNLFGQDKKLLLYGQVGNINSLFFGTYLDPAFRATKLQLRFDIYFVRRLIQEYVNDPAQPTDYAIARETLWTFADLGVLFGWRFYWWLSADTRLKPGYSQFSQFTTRPERDGWDTSVQTRLTVDHRQHRYGVTWGPYAQLITDVSVPGLSDYNYQVAAARAYYSWRFFPEDPHAAGFLGRFGREHQLEFRTSLGIGHHLPLHEELTLGGVIDLRGYPVDMFRGDRRAAGRAEYSMQLAKWWMFSFRAIGFFDAGYVGFHARDTQTREYLPTQLGDAHWIRSDVGGGVRIYVGNVVLPLLGLDYAYGLEGERHEVYFEIGLTDF
ncbi:MAG TPA: BamA/TamA family outer membrane protein [Kofleriaceae bacterium]|nr:BamA/TamA family outer membrane protein [Kofleriaceae bacterium]